MTPYLTDAEIAHITHPRTQGAARIRFFRAVVKCRCEARPNGQPLVWRQDFEVAKRAQDPAANDGPAAGGTNVEALRNRVAYVRNGKKAQRRQPARP